MYINNQSRPVVIESHVIIENIKYLTIKLAIES